MRKSSLSNSTCSGRCVADGTNPPAIARDNAGVIMRKVNKTIDQKGNELGTLFVGYPVDRNQEVDQDCETNTRSVGVRTRRNSFAAQEKRDTRLRCLTCFGCRRTNIGKGSTSSSQEGSSPLLRTWTAREACH